MDKTDKIEQNMLGLFSTLRDLFRHESPQEKYARLCYEAEQEEKRKEEKQ